MDIATITPNRGQDRPQFLGFCADQLLRLNPKPAKIYMIDDEPMSDQVDIVPRLQAGVAMAKAKGIEYAFIIESDDYYPASYLSNFSSGYDFYGFSTTIYYNLRNRSFKQQSHPGRSSLFCTGFKISALDGFVWPENNTRFVDIALWNYCRQAKKKAQLLTINPTLGIKHGIGLVGGKAHGWDMPNKDYDLKYLRSRVDDTAFEFYRKIQL
jgi:hypothetical protein